MKLMSVLFLSIGLLYGCSNHDSAFDPLETIVKKNRLNESEVVYLYMYSYEAEYKALVTSDLGFCADGKIKYLAFSTFDESTEAEFVSMLDEKYRQCYFIFYGSDKAVNEVSKYFDQGIFVAGDLKENSRIKSNYDKAVEQVKYKNQGNI
ncbi:hypothetical protein [Neptuniibacter sp. QD34_54]|uniref:hypothetical protein n=1 Tax=Neptuniibacter sp. QD34_54 TaxID=3398208 RepID=UPI0039F5BB08